jgi:hypothetical protein
LPSEQPPTSVAELDAASDERLSSLAVADEPADRVEPECPISYEVVAGDYWIRLADASGVDIDDLLDLNGASLRTPLFPGASICLPAGAAAPAPPTTAAPTPVPKPTAPPTTKPPATTPPRPASPGEVEAIIREIWPDDLEERALEIALRESKLDPTARNFCCYGVFQIYYDVHDRWLGDLGITSAEQLFDPRVNTYAAFVLYQRAGGFGPWT